MTLAALSTTESETLTAVGTNRLPKDAMARQAARLRKAANRKRRAVRKRRPDEVVVRVSRPAGTKVTVVLEDDKNRVPRPDELVSHPKRDAERFENSPYYYAYRRYSPNWGTAGRDARDH